MRTSRIPAAAAWTLVALLAIPHPAAGADPKPPKSVLTESAVVRLAQFECSVEGPMEQIRALRAEDFSLKVNGIRMESFSLDWDCPDPAASEAAATTAPAEPAPKPLRPVSFLFYFDMANLTMSGRQQAMDMAKNLMRRLVRNGNKAMILSNAATVTTVATLESDPARLEAALERLESDKVQWDPYPSMEQQRLSQVITRLNKDGPDAAIGQARAYYFEDRWRGERALNRLSMSISLLADVASPRVVVYFADTMREEPGEIYLKLFSHGVTDSVRTPAKDVGVTPLQRVVREAAAHGVRFYTVQAEGLVAASSRVAVSEWRAGSTSLSRSVPMGGSEDAQQALSSLAIETGGEAFLNGVPSLRVAEAIRADLACVLLVSFDPTDFPEDRPLSVKLTTRAPEIDLHHRGTVVVQSESALKTSRLLSAFLSPQTRSAALPIRTAVVPLGYRDRAFVALVQVSVAGSDLPGATWDIATSVVSRDRVTEQGAGRLHVSTPQVPVVFEKEMSFTAGPFEIVSVAQETESGQIGSRHLEGAWPDPDAEDAAVGPIAVLQPAGGAFLRDERPSTTGLIALTAEEAGRTDRPTALVGLVCRRKGLKAPLVVERKIIGQTTAPFAPMKVEPGDDRCFQVRDLLAPSTLSAGSFRYEIRVLREGAEIARGERVFSCVGPAAEAPPADGP